uniref:Uncharacterized protein n=1 Tax=Anguilla anguilla TaxID=7936 RepID=A0A0E9TMJ2_ANGAN
MVKPKGCSAGCFWLFEVGGGYQVRARLLA